MSNGQWLLQVGELYAPEITSWPTERFECRYFDGNHLLQICDASITEKTLEAFHYGQIHVGLFQRNQVLHILFRIEGFYDWSDQAFTMMRVDPADRALPALAPGEHTGINFFLVDANTGVIRAMRLVTYSAHASQVLHRILKEQLAAQQPQQVFEYAVAMNYAAYPTSKAMSRNALLIEKAGSKSI